MFLRDYKIILLEPTLSQMNPVHTFTTYFHFTVGLPFMPVSLSVVSSLQVSNWHCLYISPIHTLSLPISTSSHSVRPHCIKKIRKISWGEPSELSVRIFGLHGQEWYSDANHYITIQDLKFLQCSRFKLSYSMLWECSAIWKRRLLTFKRNIHLSVSW
jgi:hypothetical protein